MKKTFNIFIICLVCLSLSLSSCRKEETEFIDTPNEDIIEPQSTTADLMLRTSSNDGSNDNILDIANCFSIKLPVTVIANSINVELNTSNDLTLVESIFDEEYDDINTLDISFPITVIRPDFTEVLVNSEVELLSISQDCNGENEPDYDIECLDFTYPISASIFNTITEDLSNEALTNDKELYEFVKTIASEEIVSIDFPIEVKLFDNSTLEINSIPQLRATIENYRNSCDEDDDYDYDDDDCNHCTQVLVADILTSCQDWYVDKLKRESTDYNSAYEGYNFNFFEDGSLSVYWNTTTVYGTWSMQGTENNIIVTIDVPALPLCNNSWELQEINNTVGLAKVDFVLTTSDRLRYRNTCE